MAKKPSSEEKATNDRPRTEHEKIQERKMRDNYKKKEDKK